MWTMRHTHISWVVFWPEGLLDVLKRDSAEAIAGTLVDGCMAAALANMSAMSCPDMFLATELNGSNKKLLQHTLRSSLQQMARQAAATTRRLAPPWRGLTQCSSQ